MTVRLGCRLGLAGIIAAGLFYGIAFGAGDTARTIRHAGTIDLPGKGFVDYLVISGKGHTIYAGNAGSNALVVIDTKTKKVVTSITGLKDVRSVALVPDQNLGFTSNRGEDTVGVIDLNTNRLLSKIADGHGPDAIIYDGAAHLVYVANHEGKTGTFIDPAARNVTAVVHLGGSAEYAQADPVTGVVYQNLEDKSETVVVDPKKGEVVARYKTAPGKGPTGLALDAENHRLFCACGNDKLVVMNADNGKVTAVLPIGSGVDFVAYDPALHRIYTANGGSGTMTIVRQVSPDQYLVEDNIKTHKGAHALAIDPATHEVYVVHGNKIEIYENAAD